MHVDRLVNWVYVHSLLVFRDRDVWTMNQMCGGRKKCRENRSSNPPCSYATSYGVRLDTLHGQHIVLSCDQVVSLILVVRIITN